MANFFHTVSTWWAAHPGWVNFIYFLLAVLVSLFADRFRRLLAMPVSYSAKGFRHLTERDTRRNLEIMNLVGDSAFKLILYIAYYSLDSFIWVLWQSLLMWFVINFFVYRHDPHPVSLSALVLGFSMGQALKLKYLLEGMFNPEQTIRRLEEKLSKIGAK